MWQLTNHTPFPAETGFYRGDDGTAFWGLWLSADFQLREGKPPLFCADQRPMSRSPQFGELGRLVQDSEKAPSRALVDLIIAGHALQPSPQDKQAKRIGLRLGGWQKELALFPPLKWGPRGQPQVDPEAEPQRISVDGSASFGGAGHSENPLGHGHGDRDDVATKPPATLFPSRMQPPAAGDEGVVGAFGMLSPLWPIRSALAGTYDADWRARRQPLLPADFDPMFWQSAPTDQRLSRPLQDALALDAYGFEHTGPAETPTRLALPSLNFQCDTRMDVGWQNAEAALQALTIDLDTFMLRAHYHAQWPLRRAASDVTVSRTVVSLADTKSFRVSPVDAHFFQTASTGFSGGYDG